MISRFFFNSNKGISSKKIDSIVSKYGTNILIGCDPGENDIPSDVATPQLEYLKQLKIPTHVYFVGPGMLSWSQQERNQIKRFAKSVGIDINNSNWHKEWISYGWEQKTLQQFEWYYNNYNCYSMEIDNLDSVFEDKQDKLIPWLLKFKDKLASKKIKTKLMLKNLSTDQINNLLSNNRNFGVDFLCEFAIFEKGTGKPKEQLRLMETIGIQAITPINGLNDTHNYGVIDSGVEYSCDKSNLKELSK